MKKINSIGYGGKILVTGLLFLLPLPLLLQQIGRFHPHPFYRYAITVSISVGAVISLLFFLLLAVELRQDKNRNQIFAAQKNSKLPLKSGLFECQSCGSRQVQLEDTICKACGARFKETKHN